MQMKKISLNKDEDYLVYAVRNDGTIEIYNIAVTTERRKGVGTQLFNELKKIENPDRIWLFTRKENRIAQQFYESLGFCKREADGFYPDGDAILYFKICK